MRQNVGAGTATACRVRSDCEEVTPTPTLTVMARMTDTGEKPTGGH